MPGWPSPAERRALDAFPEQIGAEDLDEHFKLSPATCASRSSTAATARWAWPCSCARCAGWGFVPDGPFKGCKPDKHGERLDPLPLDPPPDGLF